MNGNSLVNIALAIAIIVVICLTLTFTLLYFAYGKYKRLSVKSGLEDEKLTCELLKSDERTQKHLAKPKKERKINKKINNFISKVEAKFNIKPKNENIDTTTYFGRLTYQSSYHSPLRIVYLTLYSLIMLVVFVIMIICFAYRASGEMLFLGNTTYLTIKTGSMSEVYDGNEYIKENNLTNQIEQYALIGINKINSEEDIKLYDVMAFYIDDDIYVHRVIDITCDDNGDTYYCFRGDANNASFKEECYVSFNRIIGKYNGTQSIFLGASITYLQSNIGIIAMFMALAFLINLEIQEELIDKHVYKRKQYLAKQLDKQGANK